MNPSTVDSIIHDAVSIWSNVTPLIFQKVKGQNADIKFSFWQFSKKLTWEGGSGVQCNMKAVSTISKKPTPPGPASQKNIQTKF